MRGRILLLAFAVGLCSLGTVTGAGAERVHDRVAAADGAAVSVKAERTTDDAAVQKKADTEAAAKEKGKAAAGKKKEKKNQMPADKEETAGQSIKDRIAAIVNSAGSSAQKTSYEPDDIFGTAQATEEQCVKYLLSVNPEPSISVTARELVACYYEEAGKEGIRPDVAFAQALWETGFFRYGGVVLPEQNNYCGLGSTSEFVSGGYFPSARIGVRAHIQHLLAYASVRKPAEPVVDPRYELVRDRYGDTVMTKWTDLNGRWAVPGYGYGENILEMFERLLETK